MYIYIYIILNIHVGYPIISYPLLGSTLFSGIIEYHNLLIISGEGIYIYLYTYI